MVTSAPASKSNFITSGFSLNWQAHIKALELKISEAFISAPASFIGKAFHFFKREKNQCYV